MTRGPKGDLEQAKRLERGLMAVRWFAVVLGFYLVSQTNVGAPPPLASRTVLTLGYITIAALAIGNVAVWLATNRARTLRGMRLAGAAAFALDAAVIFALAWTFSYDPKGATWVVIFILPLEGALRYQLSGALASVGLTLLNEIGREAYLASRFPVTGRYGGALIQGYNFLFSNVAFRIGIQAIIALTAGFMARSLERQARQSAEQAARFEDVARRESGARRELAAFNTAILTGVAAEDLDISLQLMAAAIGRDLGFQTFSILLREGDELVVKGMYGMPLYEDRIPLGRGVTGTVAASGRPLVVPDVSRFDNYIENDPKVRSEMTAPMRIGEEVVGVLDVESHELNAFDEAALDGLTRLADQIALVAHSNRLLSQQRETMSRLRQLDQMKSDFVAITSHELRTPLTAIRGFVNTLIRNRERMSDQQVTDFMHIIDRQSQRLVRLVEDMLLVSRIEAGAVRMAVEPVNLERFVWEVVESFGPEDRDRIELDVPPSPGPVYLDPARVEQVVRNLLENALKFSPSERAVSLVAFSSADTVTIRVSDRGVGIEPDQMGSIFDRFHQAGPVLTREAEGAGLGLYITKRLIEAMGGKIEVTSTPDEGSTFMVEIPSGSPAQTRDGSEAPAGQTEAASHPAHS